jgi:hypothetical protein
MKRKDREAARWKERNRRQQPNHEAIEARNWYDEWLKARPAEQTDVKAVKPTRA